MGYDHDIAIIGAGPGGYVAAIRAAQLGLKACVVEKDKAGGVCLNVGCIPSKSLIHQADLVLGAAGLAELGAGVDLSTIDYSKAYKASRKAAERLSKGVGFLLKKNGVEYVQGRAQLKSANEIVLDDGRVISAAAIILATGSRPRQLPGFEFDEQTVLSSTGALMLQQVPKRAVILGAGAIGMELGSVWNAFGSEVTIVELADRALPLEDPEAGMVVRKAFEKRGIRFMIGQGASGMEKKDSGIVVSLKAANGSAGQSGSKPAAQADTPGSLEADVVLVAVGRRPNTEGLGLEELGIKLDRGFVPVGEYGETAAAGIYAIGDIVATPLLAHVASKEGEIAVERIAQLLKGAPAPAESRVDLSTVPSAVYCEPELASFGLSVEKAVAGGIRHEVFSFPFRGIGKAVATEKPDGFVKIVHDPETGEILGASIVGERATDIIHELILARRAELTLEEVADMVHAHPTIAEGVMEAAKGGLGRAVHV
ncbi:MAG: dihydrolipoyl dehydrogenase [Spirochaetia bacterium]|jgi:dihydrolipoamide dehydrogenase|nr:dihydrolipoyl dehydrogenase [Spirochaetia bacterium]